MYTGLKFLAADGTARAVSADNPLPTAGSAAMAEGSVAMQQVPVVLSGTNSRLDEVIGLLTTIATNGSGGGGTSAQLWERPSTAGDYIGSPIDANIKGLTFEATGALQVSGLWALMRPWSGGSTATELILASLSANGSISAILARATPDVLVSDAQTVTRVSAMLASPVAIAAGTKFAVFVRSPTGPAANTTGIAQGSVSTAMSPLPAKVSTVGGVPVAGHVAAVDLTLGATPTSLTDTYTFVLGFYASAA